MKQLLNNKRGQTEAVILSILVFQAFVVLMLGFLDIATTSSLDNNSSSVGVVTSEAGSKLFSFGNIIDNISELGWGNAIIFSPLIVVLGYIIVRLIRGGG